MNNYEKIKTMSIDEMAEFITCDDCFYCQARSSCGAWKCGESYKFCEKYPPFTAEKQLELIKWLIRNKRLFIKKADYSNNYYMDVTYNRGDGVDNPKFESCLASLINDIWQSLTDSEKEEIRGILNE